jgi:hypothetical protein
MSILLIKYPPKNKGSEALLKSNLNMLYYK